MGLNYNPIGLQEVEGSEDAFSTASTGSEVRHREYVGQRNPTFTPTYSPDTFDYDRHAEFNQVSYKNGVINQDEVQIRLFR